MTPNHLTPYVQRGIAWLDANAPTGWQSIVARKGPLTGPDMVDPLSCVLGRLCMFPDGPAYLSDYGFNTRNHGGDAEFALLAETWNHALGLTTTTE